jgi:hypothetical protein
MQDVMRNILLTSPKNTSALDERWLMETVSLCAQWLHMCYFSVVADWIRLNELSIEI